MLSTSSFDGLLGALIVFASCASSGSSSVLSPTISSSASSCPSPSLVGSSLGSNGSCHLFHHSLSSCSSSSTSHTVGLTDCVKTPRPACEKSPCWFPWLSRLPVLVYSCCRRRPDSYFECSTLLLHFCVPARANILDVAVPCFKMHDIPCLEHLVN